MCRDCTHYPCSEYTYLQVLHMPCQEDDHIKYAEIVPSEVFRVKSDILEESLTNLSSGY